MGESIVLYQKHRNANYYCKEIYKNSIKLTFSNWVELQAFIETMPTMLDSPRFIKPNKSSVVPRLMTDVKCQQLFDDIYQFQEANNGK